MARSFFCVLRREVEVDEQAVGATSSGGVSIPAQSIAVPEQELKIEVTAVPKGEGQLPMPGGEPVSGVVPASPLPPVAPTPAAGSGGGSGVAAVAPVLQVAPMAIPAQPSVVVIDQQAYIRNMVEDLRHASEVARLAIVTKHDSDMQALKDLMDSKGANQQAIDAEKDKAVRVQYENNQLAVKTALDSMVVRLESMNEFRAQINTERGTYATKDSVDATMKASEVLGTERLSTMSSRIEQFASEMRQADDRISNAASQRLDTAVTALTDRMTKVENKFATNDGSSLATRNLIAVIATILGIVATVIALSTRFF